MTGGHPINTTARHRATVYRIPGLTGLRRTVRYRVRRKDLASRIYRSLSADRWKPGVFATARLLWLCELTIMPVIPGISLGTNMIVRHVAPAVRGELVTVTATCIARQGNYWDWRVEVRDAQSKLLAECTLRFISDIDRQRYQRRLARQTRQRSAGLACWLRLLDVLSLVTVAALPLQMAYAWHNWTARLVTETVLIVGWLLTLAGVPCVISDWLTIRRNAGDRPGPRHR